MRRSLVLCLMLSLSVANYSLFTSHYTLLSAQTLTIAELNCENLFDCGHDSLKQDHDWLPGSVRSWTPRRYWQKLNNIGQELVACSETLPDLIALVEVENDSVMRDLTRRSVLRGARYDYLMTQSDDVRGIDVALLYQHFTFRPVCYDMLHVVPLPGMRPTRDILYVKGEFISGDTLHVFVVHAPSRYGGERATRPNRRVVADRLLQAVDSVRVLSPDAKIIVTGDFNDYAASPALCFLAEHHFINVTSGASGSHGARATYRYQGQWNSIDHVLVNAPLLQHVDTAYIFDAPFLLEEDRRYGGVKPLRTYNGYRYQRGFSDHLPLVVRLKF